GQPIVASEVAAIGPDARGSLSLSLDQAKTLAVLFALKHLPVSLTVVAEVTYRTAALAQTIHLTGHWAIVYDDLRNFLGVENELEQSGVEASLTRLIESGTVRVECISDTGSVAIVHANSRDLLALFLRASSFILGRTTPDLDPNDLRNRYVLGTRPSELLPMD